MEPRFKLLGCLLLVAGAAQVGRSALVAAGGECDFEIAESMPDGLVLAQPAGAPLRPTHESLIEMVEGAQKSIRIASYYLMLTPADGNTRHPATRPGLLLRDAILRAAKRGLDVEIVVDNSTKHQISNLADVAALEEAGARVKMLNMRRLNAGGIQHSKFLIADNQTLYLGSANFDWRAYTQVKEIGIAFKHCPRLAQDLDKIYRTYALMSAASELPERMSSDFEALTSLEKPLELASNGLRVSLAGSPPPFNRGTGRADDIDGLLRVLERAERSIDISVMNYSPLHEYGQPKEYWPLIDEALRRAATERNVRVRLLFSKWSSSKPLELVWYKSLNALHTPLLGGAGGIHVKLFQVPAFDEYQRSVPFARVKHDKYMVTDRALYIGTSNWAPAYFTNTCGVGLVVESGERADGNTPQLIRTMQDVFERDFNSEYAHELS